MNIGRRIVNRRKTLGLTQQQMDVMIAEKIDDNMR